jgi:Flp pilus assembly protein protease CpaA
MNFGLILLAIPVCIADISSFVIPNIYNKVLSYAALIHISLFGIGQVRQVVFSLAILLALLFFGTGMGDIKLLTLILVTHSLSAIDFLGFVFLLTIVHIVVLVGVHRRIPIKIPLAPSIFIGLATYLATR